MFSNKAILNKSKDGCCTVDPGSLEPCSNQQWFWEEKNICTNLCDVLEYYKLKLHYYFENHYSITYYYDYFRES